MFLHFYLLCFTIEKFNLDLAFTDVSELPCTIVSHLKDLEATEKGIVTLSIVLSKARKVKWMKGKVLVPSDCKRFEESVSETGLEHALTVSDISLEDSGCFTAEVDDNHYGIVTSSCMLSVKGIIDSF